MPAQHTLIQSNSIKYTQNGVSQSPPLEFLTSSSALPLCYSAFEPHGITICSNTIYNDMRKALTTSTRIPQKD